MRFDSGDSECLPAAFAPQKPSSTEPVLASTFILNLLMASPLSVVLADTRGAAVSLKGMLDWAQEAGNQKLFRILVGASK